MDLSKLLDLLHSRELYLRRADGFLDRLEGALFPSLRRLLDDGQDNTVNADHFYRRARLGNYVSCWSLGGKDSMALWQLYGGVKTSVAVTTTIEKLAATVASWRVQAFVHQVQYVDHLTHDRFLAGRYSEVLRYKNEAYSFEKELRVVIPMQEDGWEQNPTGLRLKVDLNSLVRSVVVAPEADESFRLAVAGLCHKYGLGAPVKRSKLSLIPV